MDDDAVWLNALLAAIFKDGRHCLAWSLKITKTDITNVMDMLGT
jgi:hypothetical protein